MRRTAAQELCEAGAVSVNGVTARSSRAVKVGDEITLKRRERELSVRVRELPATKQVARGDAASLYEVLSERIIERDRLDL